MKKTISFFLLIGLLSSCKKNNDATEVLSLNISGLEELGASFRYEGWVIVNGTPVTTGTFSVDASGNLSKTTFDIDKSQLNSATDFVLTIEPFPDTDPAPTATHILAGSFSGKTASVSIADAKALGTDFSTASGKYILATPTDGAGNNEKSGLWFIDISGGSPAQGLFLPALPAGWKYEGWAVIGGKPISTGTFTNPAAADDSAPFSGTMGSPPFPGEDFLVNAPAGFAFPTNLSGGLAVISVEPFPDNSPAPFTLKPLLANISASAMEHFTYAIPKNPAALPSGTVSR